MKTKQLLILPMLALSAIGLVGCNPSSGSSSSGATSSSGTSTSTDTSSSGTTEVTGFTGTANLAGVSFDEKTELLGQMEAYAMRNHLTGIPLYGSGGYTLLSTRFDLPVDNYVANYGFGLLREGSVNTSMTSTQEPVSDWVDYYHTETSALGDALSSLDASDTSVSAQVGYITSDFWGQRLIKNNDAGKTYQEAYEWYPSYADQEDPTPVDWDEESGTATTWRFKVKTGANSGLKYRTLSTKSIDGVNLKDTYDNMDVKVEDYIFALKALTTVSYDNYYSFQYASDVSAIVGAEDYYMATYEAGVGITDADAAAAWENVGYKAVDEETIEVSFVYPTDAFGVKYRLSGSLLAPINQSFYTLVCTGDADGELDDENFEPQYYGKFNADKSITPADSVLSCGPYICEEYSSGTGTDNRVIFTRNDSWIEIANELEESGYNIYQIPGIKISLNSAALTSSTAVYEDFKAGKCDTSSIPSAYADAEAGDSDYKHWVDGDSVWKLQVNSLTQEEWDAIFDSETGYVYKGYRSDADNHYECKPIMSNDNFINGVYTAIDREELADLVNADVADSFFSDAFEIDPINHVIYNESDAHKKVMEDYFPDTYGYNYEASQQLFSAAIDELLADGSYEAGTADNPNVITVQAAFQTESQFEEEGYAIKNYVETAFNSVGVAKGVKLNFELYAPTNWYDIYYSMTLLGKYDFAFASISGGTLDPFNFMNTLCSNSSSTFTLSWGAHTNENDGTIVYDGYSYSYDAMYAAVVYGNANLVDGEVVDE